MPNTFDFEEEQEVMPGVYLSKPIKRETQVKPLSSHYVRPTHISDLSVTHQDIKDLSNQIRLLHNSNNLMRAEPEDEELRKAIQENIVAIGIKLEKLQHLEKLVKDFNRLHGVGDDGIVTVVPAPLVDESSTEEGVFL